MLPKYRRLVEVLAQRGLLRVICGTDTLGVGINVPIRTVLLTALSKYDGVKMRQLSAREFHQIAGRAGRAGYDTAGLVVVQAPDHEVENALATTKAGDDPKKKKKIVRKSAPAGFVTWSETSFERLVGGAPEPLESRMQVSAAMLINLIARGGDVFGNARALLTENHEPPHRQRELVQRALGIAKTLVRAGVVVIDRTTTPATITLTVDLQPNFALNQPLSPFALAVIGVLDHADANYPIEVISVIESTLDNPRPVLAQQQFAARGEAIGAMKAEGLDYDERMEALDDVEYPKPLVELLTAMFETFASTQPWIRDVELRPKSVVRDLYEKAMTFTEYVSHYKLTRSEGLLLRYLSDADRAIRQTVPDEAKTDELRDIIEWLRELVRQVDSSLQDEWEQLSSGFHSEVVEGAPALPPRPPDVTTNRRAFLVLVRNELFRRSAARGRAARRRPRGARPRRRLARGARRLLRRPRRGAHGRQRAQRIPRPDRREPRGCSRHVERAPGHRRPGGRSRLGHRRGRRSRGERRGRCRGRHRARPAPALAAGVRKRRRG